LMFGDDRPAESQTSAGHRLTRFQDFA
jgi:hypothetical protein